MVQLTINLRISTLTAWFVLNTWFEKQTQQQLFSLFVQPSPTDTEEMEFLSAADNDDTQPSDISPFNVASGLDDAASPSSCHLDPVEEEPQVSGTPFT